MESTKNRRLVIAIMLVTVVLITIGGTFAYFLTTAGRNEEQKLTIKTGNLALTFEDNDSGLTGSIMIGESREKLFIIKNTGTQPVTTNMIWDGLINTYLEESLSYILEYKTTEDGEYQSLDTAHINVPQSERADDYNLAKNITIPAGSTYYYKLTIIFNNLPDINQEADRTAILSTKFNLGEAVNESPSLYTLKKLKLTAKDGDPNFSNIATTDETIDGLYFMADDYGTSYYYRGAVENNYIKFGGFYWRIIRINGDGSIRMIYDGTKAWPNANGIITNNLTQRVTHSEVAFNTSYGDNIYAGWKLGNLKESQDSNLKKIVDLWYEENLISNTANNKSNITNYLSDEIFCGDRSLYKGSGIGATETFYGSYERLSVPGNQKNPELKCPLKNDSYTVNDIIKGNGALKYKIGLITADEIVIAGGNTDIPNNYFYLYKGRLDYWSLTPSYVQRNGTGNIAAYINTFHSMGGLGSTYNHATIAVAPVINISPEYAKTMVGEGSMTSPYQIPGVE